MRYEIRLSKKKKAIQIFHNEQYAWDSDHMFYEGKWSADCPINKQDNPQS